MPIDLLGQLGNINAVQNQQDNTITKETLKTNDNLFESFYNSALSTLSETNQIQLDSDALQQDFATGATDNILSVMVAQNKANTSLNFTVQVVNKLITAYQEIMRIQI